MINMVQNAKDQAAALAMAAYQAAVADGTLPAAEVKTAPVEIPKDTANGDFTTTFALAASKALRQPPRNIAQALLDHMDLTGSYFASAEIAGPGFLNFRLNDSWYAAVCEAVEAEGAVYGTNDGLKGQKIMVEFVSANPTGPMHMGNARGGVLGDTLASVLTACGADVTREFYVNDAGHQIDKFAHSIEARYLQIIQGEENVPFPEDGYQGEDIKDLARAYYEENGDKLVSAPEQERLDTLAQFGLSVNLPKMKTDLERYKIHYDNWFYESALHESGYVKETVDLLTERGWTYEKDGALWLRTADILRDHFRKQGKKEADIEKLDLKDDVLRRANGFYTYFAADIAYHRNKFAVRGFDRVINIWGADHHGHVARLKGALDAIGLDGDKLDIVLMQLVKLLRDGEVVRMSKRTGKAISLSDLLDEVSVDAARWYFNAKPDTQMEFDLGLAVREDSENPIYYVEYAHARICSLLRTLGEENVSVPAQADVDMSLLTGEAERALLKQIAQFSEVIKLAARDYDPSYINRYLQELAGCFHRFYTACRIRGEEAAVRDARLKLADDTRIVLRNGLKLIGVEAPEKM
ncbi:arginine--tRNA ligase [uncultured Oscillibacter sp.]|uniref:arginine--tRNA ligase n=1 Tax=uncultured Oscillibacter sp. TaxID=876091 RepID=UPI001F92F527|nr:arginine--tRNA ligase [uncultured Oscillibacter sp.]HJB77402.1 arginine--tRNA ligase [Candidatus Oscillibacter avistercoris]